MLLLFDQMKAHTIPNMNNGTGAVSAKMLIQPNVKIMQSRLPASASIEMHTHTGSYELNYVISGIGTAVCDGTEEPLSSGCYQYCPQGASHSIANTGVADLVLFTVVPTLEESH